jgi:hypothetical protein
MCLVSDGLGLPRHCDLEKAYFSINIPTPMPAARRPCHITIPKGWNDVPLDLVNASSFSFSPVILFMSSLPCMQSLQVNRGLLIPVIKGIPPNVRLAISLSLIHVTDRLNSAHGLEIP